jgi:hypothetical protein
MAWRRQNDDRSVAPVSNTGPAKIASKFGHAILAGASFEIGDSELPNALCGVYRHVHYHLDDIAYASLPIVGPETDSPRSESEIRPGSHSGQFYIP